MGRYLIRRTLFAVLVLVIISFLTFVIFVKLPVGDPARRAVGRGATEQTLAAAREQMGLDKPFFVQYARFAKGLVPVFWGEHPMWLDEDVYYSWSNRQSVKTEIREAFPYTAWLTLGSAVLWLLIGIPIGIVSALRRRTWVDRAGMVFALVFVSAPVFWVGLVFIYVFYYKLRWAPPIGTLPGQSAIDMVIHGQYILPWVTLALTSAALYARIVRGDMLDTMSQDYIRTARAKGLSERRVTFRHGLRACLTPVVTILGLDIAGLLGGAIITEQVFAINGLGKYTIEAIQRTDFPVIMGVTIVASMFIVVANLVVDIIYAGLDPRVRYT
jgi:peptide/nickel transport system permease protein